MNARECWEVTQRTTTPASPTGFVKPSGQGEVGHSVQFLAGGPLRDPPRNAQMGPTDHL